MTERLDDLEIKLAFQDKLVRELADLVRTFGDRLDRTERALKQLEDAVRSPAPTAGPANEPPPHY